MKINRYNTITALACYALLAVATTSIAQPLLNGSFEAPAAPGAPTDWTLNLSGGVGTNTTLYAQSGNQSLLLDATGTGGWAVPNAVQTFTAVAGDVFNLKGYMFTPTTLDASYGLFKIEFLNGPTIIAPASVSIGGSAAGPFFGAESTPFLNSGSAAGSWIFSETQGTAPVGTTTVKFYALNVNPPGAGRKMFFDNIVATKITTTPIAAAITLPAANALVGGNFTIIANASVAPGAITNVYFYMSNNVPAAANTLLGSDATSPYSFSVNSTANGSYAFRAVAYGTNSAGAPLANGATSSVVNVTVNAAVFNLVPNGNFETAGGADWVFNGPALTTFPASGGNPGGYGDIDSLASSPWGVLVSEINPTTGRPLASLGLTAGNTYAFSFDMKGDAGGELAGIKIEGWNAGAEVGNSGDIKFTAGTSWATYTPSWTIPATASSIKFVPLSLDSGHVGFDNVGVVSTVVLPLAASITSPANLATVTPNFTINAFASAPGGVTSVDFYTNNVLLGTDSSAGPTYSLPVTGAADGSLLLKVVANHGGGSFTSSVVTVSVVSTANLYVDPSKPWQGFMNVSDTPADGGAFAFGSPWVVADLRANFSGSTLTLAPNTIGDPNPYWYDSIGNNSVANKIMEANMFVEPAGSLPGVTVTFSGMCLNNTLTTNAAFNGPLNPAGDSWTSVAFIKDLNPDFSAGAIVTMPLTNGMKFSVSLLTVNDPTRHVQYGFTTTGPCVWTNDVALPTYGNVVIAPGPAVAITPSVSGANVNLSFPSVLGYNYQAQYKNNLTDANWINVGAAANGTGATIVLTDTHTLPSRFYRLSVQ